MHLKYTAVCVTTLGLYVIVGIHLIFVVMVGKVQRPKYSK